MVIFKEITILMQVIAPVSFIEKELYGFLYRSTATPSNSFPRMVNFALQQQQFMGKRVNKLSVSNSSFSLQTFILSLRSVPFFPLSVGVFSLYVLTEIAS